MDYKKAFDYVDHKILLQMFAKYKACTVLTRMAIFHIRGKQYEDR